MVDNKKEKRMDERRVEAWMREECEEWIREE